MVIFRHCPESEYNIYGVYMYLYKGVVTLLLCDPVVATEGDDIVEEFEETNLAMSYDWLRLEGRPPRYPLLFKGGQLYPLLRWKSWRSAMNRLYSGVRSMSLSSFAFALLPPRYGGSISPRSALSVSLLPLSVRLLCARCARVCVVC
jgi:hypothetical protein